jgi:D-sedoheptulose 7-phosphate isomerase
VLSAAQAAAQADIAVIGMTGRDGGMLGQQSNICLAVPSDVTMHIQESHIALGHAMTLAVEKLLGH